MGYVYKHGRTLTSIDVWTIFALSLTMIWSAAAFVGNAIPWSVRGQLSDGAVMLALLRGGPWAERFGALNMLSTTSATLSRRPVAMSLSTV
jgi:hypothetical protein